MDNLFTIFIFLLTLSILIVAHEYGHYRMAKWCGVKVLRFSIGFGKPFLTWKVGKDQTEFALAPFLLGGYVRMLDSREKEVSEEEKGRDFSRKPLIKRALIVFAGPAANFLLAIVFLAGIALFSTQNYAVKIDQPVAGSALAQTGIGSGDEIVGISIGDSGNSKSVLSWMKLFILLQYASSIKEDVQIQYKRPDGTVAAGILPIKALSAEGSVKNLPRNLGFSGMWHPAHLSDVVANGVADRAGLKAGDTIKNINGRVIHDARELLQTIQSLS
ncbi:MAG: RIP metalloprotease RseP, partial [Saezia sp.]